MIRSMTGFAQKMIMLQAKDGSHAQLSVTIKSLNSRFFEYTCKLPYALAYLETDFVKLLKSTLKRGNVSLIVQTNNPSIFKGPVQADVALAKSYATAIEKIQTHTEIGGALDIGHIISLPNIFSIEEQAINQETELVIRQAVTDTLNTLLEMRTSEGSALSDDLQKRAQIMHEELGQLKTLSAKIMTEKKKAVAQKLGINEELTQEVADSQRAVYFMELDKVDIHEELTRLASHLETFHKFLQSSDEEKGRRLDFILQELGREANTIAAKSSDAAISTSAINLKVEIEKAREQVQNIV